MLLNHLLFLPIYLFFRAETTFWPWETLSDMKLTAAIFDFFLQRDNLDIFRLNIELLAVTLLSIAAPSLRRGWFVAAASILYLAQLLFAVYEGFVRSYYLLEPIVYNDFFLFADGFRFVLNSLSLSPWMYAGGGLLILLALAFLFGLNWLLLAGIPAGRLTKATRLGLAGLAVAVWGPLALRQGDLGGVETAVTSFTAKIARTSHLSHTAKLEADRFDNQQLAPFYQFTTTELNQKPDIYLIFLESYGSVLYKRTDFRQTYNHLLETLTEQLNQDHWAIASALSDAPTWGGGSWISYTSALSGLHLNSHAQYLAMFNRYNHGQPFPHLVNYLRGQGYRSYRLSANSDQLNDIEWQRYKNFYGVDEWLRFYDMQYDGPLFGWGPSPPDQYALNFAYEQMEQTADTPHVFFYITQNSHYPWTPLPDVVPDWQDWNSAPPVEPPPAQRLPLAVMRRQYLASIEYELTMLTNFITQKADENDIFIIIGDHQPARVARYSDGWDTPLHLISRNEQLIDFFHEQGFTSGLAVPSHKPTMRHEGLYSLFMRAFLQEYGRNPNNLPIYRPDGVPLQ